MPDEESFFLASLLPSRSLLRESCSCCQKARSTILRTDIRNIINRVETYHSLPKAFHRARRMEANGKQRHGRRIAALQGNQYPAVWCGVGAFVPALALDFQLCSKLRRSEKRSIIAVVGCRRS